jgi:hypothetical protein
MLPAAAGKKALVAPMAGEDIRSAVRSGEIFADVT